MAQKVLLQFALPVDMREQGKVTQFVRVETNELDYVGGEVVPLLDKSKQHLVQVALLPRGRGLVKVKAVVHGTDHLAFLLSQFDNLLNALPKKVVVNQEDKTPPGNTRLSLVEGALVDGARQGLELLLGDVLVD